MATEKPHLPALIQYWDQREIPADVATLLLRIRDGNPNLDHLVFDRSSALDLIAANFSAREVAAFEACRVPAMQADYFRYCAVSALGGIYVDADFSFARPLRPLLDAEGQLFEQRPRGPMLNNLFAFREPRHPFLAMTIEIATRNIESRPVNHIGIVTGPAIFTGLVQLSRDRPLENLLPQVNPAWRADVEANWDKLTTALTEVAEELGPPFAALEQVKISSREEMLTWVDRSAADLAYKDREDYWANWRGSIFSSGGGEDGP